jgi:xylan 1,4-beta-xylosidase
MKGLKLNSSGFDPALFHDDDGTSWLLNMVWDYRSNQNSFAGIVIQQLDRERLVLVGASRIIFQGTQIGYTEGPHVYKRDGWYYLVVAEGGTSYGHCVTVARSRSLFGPYEVHPLDPFFTSVVDRTFFMQDRREGRSGMRACIDGLQKAGHASFAPVSEQFWVMAYLCSRPLPGTSNCPLGRETALEFITWYDGWPWPQSRHPRLEIDAPVSGTSNSVRHDNAWVEHFNSMPADEFLQTVRVPISRFASIVVPGWLRILGGQSLASPKRHVIGRRITSHNWQAECMVDARPTTFQHLAGLTVRYDEANQVSIVLSHDEQKGHDVVFVVSFDNKTVVTGEPVLLPSLHEPVCFKARCSNSKISFQFSFDHDAWQRVGPEFDFGILSDEHVKPIGFTGAFIGLTCCDLASTGFTTDFDYISYEELIE